MTKQALSINFPIERAVLSDFLPFEVPITFSNRYFYQFIVKNKIKYTGKYFSWLKKDEALTKLILLLLGLDQNTEISEFPIKGVIYLQIKIDGKNTKKIKLSSIAFTFSINHKHNSFRYLSVMHPKGQLLGINFYENFKDLITYYSNLSPLSLRSAQKVAGCTYIDTKSLIESYDDEESEDDGVELDGQNYENLKSFFVYKKYKNIYKFYESTDHHWCEKRFNFLSKLDVSSCFDSIYTHSIAWAVLQKDYIKSNLNVTKSTFAYQFDQLMQRLNYNETNGILIGPEISRIFAEIIMQSIDNEVVSELQEQNIVLEKDYQIYRYVDDYFIFYNDTYVFDTIRLCIQRHLKSYKLGLNNHKEEIYSRPIITPITIAKKKISDLISQNIRYETGDEPNEKKIYISVSSLSKDFKSILATAGVTYSDVLNYSLAIIEKKVKKILFDFKKEGENDAMEWQLINALVSIINFSYFIYAVEPKVNSTIKLCRVIQRIIVFIKKHKLGIEYQHIIFKSIFDNSCSILEKHSINNATSVETLYLLVLIRQLGKYYWLDESILMKYFNIKYNNDQYIFNTDLNYFSITSLLFYVSDKKRYELLKKGLLRYVEKMYEEKEDTLLDESEMVHLTLDLIACPYIELSFKKTLLAKYGISKSLVRNIINQNKFWFTKWNNFDFSKELDAKLSKDVY